MKRCLFVVLLAVMCISNVHAEGAWTYITQINGQEVGYVFALQSGNNGELWVSSLHGSAYIYHYVNNGWVDESEHLRSISPNVVTDIDIAPNGDVWFCSYNILVKYNGENWVGINAPDVMQDIGIGVNNKIWCSTDHGVLRYDGSNWTTYTTADGLAANGVTHLVMGSTGEPWVRYGDPYTLENQHYYGVSHYNGITWETYNIDNGLQSNKVDDIAFGTDSTIYVSYSPLLYAESGVSRYNGVGWEKITTKSGKMISSENNLWVTVLSDGHLLCRYDGVSWNEYHCDIPVSMNGRTVIDTNGKIWIGTGDGVITYDSITAVDDITEKPLDFSLLHNYPNPFNAATTIIYTLNNPGVVKLDIYNISGQKVASLLNDYLDKGSYKKTFHDTGLSSGRYFARLESGGVVTCMPMLLVK
jgi:ligand-binding sensor domain-containing protein